MSVITDTFQSGLSIPLFTLCSKLIGQLPKELPLGHYRRLIAFIIQSLVFCSQWDMRRCLLRRLHGLENLDVFVRVSKQGPCLTSTENAGHKRLLQQELALEADWGAASSDLV